MDTIEFFDAHAPHWDSYQTDATHAAIAQIFAIAAFRPALRYLDVGAGTGILYPYFRAAHARAYTGIDISPEMVRIFKSKYPEADVREADFETRAPDLGLFDAVMIFNSFPHFPDEETVFSRAYDCLAPGGRLLVCHSMSREALAEHHRTAGGAVGEDVLISDDRFRELFAAAGFTSTRVENSDLFYAEGTK